MRVSVDPSDPGYANFVKYGHARCYLNGALKASALTADDVAGEVLCHRGWVAAQDGTDIYRSDPVLLRGFVKIEFLRGSVKQPASAPIKHTSQH